MEQFNPAPLVTVIIPTLCSANRAESLKRGLRSIFDNQCSTEAAVCVLVVVNGSSVDEPTFAFLQKQERVKILRLNQPGVAKAQRVGRNAVDTRYFCFLDDDDELVSHSLAWRIEALERNRDIDVLVADGYRNENGVDLPCNSLPGLDEDPHECLLRANWLASCAALFRTASVRASLWDGVSDYYEFTIIAHALALESKIQFDARFGYRIHFTPGSASQSTAFRVAEISALEKILAMPLPKKIRRGVEAKLGNAHHIEADQLLRSGTRTAAWRHHQRSLVCPDGHRFVLYTRFFFAPDFLLRKSTK